MIKFDCNKCCHASICKFREVAAMNIDDCNNRPGIFKPFKLNLECEYYEGTLFEKVK